MTMEEARKQFPHTWTDLVYLNHAAISPMGFRVREALNAFFERRSLRGIEPYPWAQAIANETKELLAKLLGCSAGDLAFVLNTSDGLNILATGIDWQPGDRILLNSLEFPSNRYPFYNLKRRGVEIDVIPAKDYRVTPEDIRSHLTDRTKLVSISYVQFGTGAKADLTAIGALCHERGVLLAVDAIQALPHTSIDVVRDHVDFLASGSHKWLMSPLGTSFIYSSARVRDAIHQAYLGWSSVRDPFQFTAIDPERLRDDAGRFENGTLNFPGIVGLNAALKLFGELGTYEMEQRVLDLADYLIDRLDRRGFEVVTPKARSEHAGIVSFKVSDPAAVQQRLASKDVVISNRGEFLRVSPYFYNTEEELRKFMVVLTE